MEFVLIRHGRTRGNLEGRYIGCRTDEPLLPEERARMGNTEYPAVDAVFASPMRRCMETAALIYPDHVVRCVSDLRECNFGAFENRNYEELKDEPAYQAWLNSGGEAPFPGGECRSAFSARCVRAFEETVRNLPQGRYAFVVHGGTIMAIMERFALPRRDYYDFQLKNGEGYILDGSGKYQKL